MLHFYSRWLPLTGLVLFVALTLHLMQPPQPVSADAPATEFSASRAMRDLAVIAQRPHPAGTPAHAAVREYLLRRCRALGLTPVVQDTSVVYRSPRTGQVVGGRVQNIIARQPGRVPGNPAVLVVAHYDSQPQTPGAGDDGAGVAALLEAMRALRAGSPLTHDVIWLFTDGEETGLLGAHAFAADSVRLRREVGVAFNFEGRGNRGPSITFEVSPQNGWVIREFARAVPAPLASSLFYEVYRHLPNDTDFTPLRQAGLTGLNSSFVGGFPYYHSPADTPEHLNPASLQHHGTNLLALVRHFGTISLAQTKAPDYSFFNPLGTWLVLYPASWNLPLTLLTIGLLLLTASYARRQRRLSWASLLGGLIAWVGVVVLGLIAGWALLKLVGASYPEYQIFYGLAAYNGLAYGAALLALAGAIFAAYYAELSRRTRPDSLTGGALLAVALLLGLLQWQATSGAFLLALPLLASTLAWAWRLRRGVGPTASLAPGILEVLLALPALALLAPALYLLIVIFDLQLLVLVSLLLLLVLLGLLLPILLPVLVTTTPDLARAENAREAIPRVSLSLPALSLLVALVALGWAHLARHPTVDQPQQTDLSYFLDADHKQGYWVSNANQHNAWSAHVLSQPQYSQFLPSFSQSAPAVLWQAAVPRALAALAPPEIRILADHQVASGRQLRLLLLPGRAGVTQVVVRLGGASRLRSLRLAGHDLALQATDRVPNQQTAPDADTTPLSFFAPRLAGEILELTLTGNGPLEMALTSRSPGLPPEPTLPALPATLVPAPGYSSFTTQVRRSFLL